MCAAHNDWNKAHLIVNIPKDPRLRTGDAESKKVNVNQADSIRIRKNKAHNRGRSRKNIVTINTYRGVQQVYRRSRAEISESEQEQ